MKRAAILSAVISVAALIACIAGCGGCAPIPTNIGDAWIAKSK